MSTEAKGPGSPSHGTPIVAEDRITVTRLSPQVSTAQALIQDIRTGFASKPWELPPKYFYDVDGSGIFEQIVELPEYYVGRVETDILSENAPDIVSRGKWNRLVELGSGASKKTRSLLSAMERDKVVYVPFDISESALLEAAAMLTRDYAQLEVEGYVGDFLGEDLDTVLRTPLPKLVAFLGNTLGNFSLEQRQKFFEAFAESADERDGLLLGVDLVKSPDIIEPAYNDSAGVTAKFNTNVLRVLRKELGASVNPDDFRHHAPYIPERERVEMRLYADRDVDISFAEGADLPSYALSRGDYLLTELSHKFTREGLEADLDKAGLALNGWWTDEKGWVAVALAQHA